jgi:uncharacterized protein (TIGR03435 family)
MKNTFTAFAVILSLIVNVVLSAAQNRGADARAKFEIVSIRPYTEQSPRPGGRGGGPANPMPCSSMGPVVDPGRLVVSRTTTYRLITWAYEPRACQISLGLITGPPDWTMADLFDLQATIPAGTPAYGRLRFQEGNAPKLQEMLQTMLEDRFKLALHREKKEMAVFNLVVAKPGRMQPSADQTPPPDPYGAGNGIVIGPGGAPPRGVMMMGNGVFQGSSITIASLATGFGARGGRPVIDKTGLTGFFDIRVPIVMDPADAAAPGLRGAAAANSDPQILDALGLKLEPARAMIDVIVIDHIEKPSPN